MSEVAGVWTGTHLSQLFENECSRLRDEMITTIPPSNFQPKSAYFRGVSLGMSDAWSFLDVVRPTVYVDSSQLYKDIKTLGHHEQTLERTTAGLPTPLRIERPAQRAPCAASPRRNTDAAPLPAPRTPSPPRVAVPESSEMRDEASVALSERQQAAVMGFLNEKAQARASILYLEKYLKCDKLWKDLHADVHVRHSFWSMTNQKFVAANTSAVKTLLKKPVSTVEFEGCARFQLRFKLSSGSATVVAEYICSALVAARDE